MVELRHVIRGGGLLLAGVLLQERGCGASVGVPGVGECVELLLGGAAHGLRGDTGVGLFVVLQQLV